jgi:hypothetical protein
MTVCADCHNCLEFRKKMVLDVIADVDTLNSFSQLAWMLMQGSCSEGQSLMMFNRLSTGFLDASAFENYEIDFTCARLNALIEQLQERVKEVKSLQAEGMA